MNDDDRNHEELVLTPAGYVSRSQVRRVEPGQRVEQLADGTLAIVDAPPAAEPEEDRDE